MGKIGLVTVWVVVAVALVCSRGLAGKITVDPNAPGAQAVVLATSADPRLAQKVTYDSGYKRLSDVVDELARVTGVPIKCGQNKSDWRLRDIPIVVCIKDMPLGKVLRAIADATHTRFTSEKIGNDEATKSYRIYRRSKEETEINTLLENRHAARLAQVMWQWDAMAAYGNSKEVPGIRRDTWLKARLIASLGPGGRNKLLSGDTIRFNGTDPAHQAIVGEMYQKAWERSNRVHTGPALGAVAPPNSEEAEQAAFRVKLKDSGDSGETVIETSFGPLLLAGKQRMSLPSDLGDIRRLQGKGIDLPPLPSEAAAPDPQGDIDNPYMVVLEKEGWNRPVLKEPIDVEKPKDVKELTFAELIRALSAASGLNIVTEDFISHVAFTRQRMEPLFKKGTTVAATLRDLRLPGLWGYRWFVNENDKLLIGWADDSWGHAWRDHHRNLIAKDYLDSLKAKYESSGIELDDAVRLTHLPERSFEEWIRYSRELGIICIARGGTYAAWQLYDSLEAPDKALTRTEAGLPLGKFDATWVSGFFREQRAKEGMDVREIYSTSALDQAASQERDFNERAVFDPQAVSTMVMRVIPWPARYRFVQFTNPDGSEGSRVDPTPGPLKLSEYRMIISYKADGEDRSITMTGPPLGFPVRSSEREAEILKAAAGEDKGGKKDGVKTK